MDWNKMRWNGIKWNKKKWKKRKKKEDDDKGREIINRKQLVTMDIKIFKWKTVFIVGEEANNYTLSTFVEVFDIYKATSRQTAGVVVRPLQLDAAAIDELADDVDSDFDSGDFGKATGKLSTPCLLYVVIGLFIPCILVRFSLIWFGLV